MVVGMLITVSLLSSEMQFITLWNKGGNGEVGNRSLGLFCSMVTELLDFKYGIHILD